MGNNQGVVWNDSNLPIQYCIYGAFEEISAAKTRRVINPKFEIGNGEKGISLDGFELSTEV